MTAVAVARSVHVGRQAICDGRGALYGYELLFRHAAHAQFAVVRDGDRATTTTILAAFAEFDPRDLLGGLPGFVNLTRAFLIGRLPIPFGPDEAVLEVLETVRADAEVMDGVRHLVERGYRIAIDDYESSTVDDALIDLASIVKIDVSATPWPEVLEAVRRCHRPGLRLLAERVEDAEMLARCLDAGFELFQGYHLGRPQTLTVGSLSPDHLVALQLVVKLSRPDVTVVEVERLLRADPGIVLQLMRLANSAANGLTREISTIGDAIVLLGLDKLRAWMVLISLAGGRSAGADVSVPLTRAYTCEQVARSTRRCDPHTAFTLGLFHGPCEALGLAPRELLDRLPPLAPALQAALLSGPNPGRELSEPTRRLRAVLDAVTAYEREDYAAMSDAGVPLPDVSAAYLSALVWTSQMVAPTLT